MVVLDKIFGVILSYLIIFIIIFAIVMVCSKFIYLIFLVTPIGILIPFIISLCLTKIVVFIVHCKC